MALVGVRGHRPGTQVARRRRRVHAARRATPSGTVLPTLVRGYRPVDDPTMIWLRRLFLIAVGALIVCAALLVWEAADGPDDPDLPHTSGPRPLSKGMQR